MLYCAAPAPMSVPSASRIWFQCGNEQGPVPDWFPDWHMAVPPSRSANAAVAESLRKPEGSLAEFGTDKYGEAVAFERASAKPRSPVLDALLCSDGHCGLVAGLK